MADLIVLKPSHYSAICLFLTKFCFEIHLHLWEEKGNFGCICFVKMKYLVKAKKKKTNHAERRYFSLEVFFLFSISIMSLTNVHYGKIKIKKKEENFKTYKFLPFGNNSVNVLA